MFQSFAKLIHVITFRGLQSIDLFIAALRMLLGVDFSLSLLETIEIYQDCFHNFSD